jgi:hypothetical protein
MITPGFDEKFDKKNMNLTLVKINVNNLKI